jgi:hypothetical protein
LIVALGKRLAKSTGALTRALEPSVQRAFRRSVRDLQDNVNFSRLKAALAKGDVDAAVEALNIDEGWVPLQDEVVKAFKTGGRLTMDVLAQEAKKAARG